MNFNKIVGGATTAFNRAWQYTEEKLGTAEKTEYDAQFENLLARVDQYEAGITKVLTCIEAYIQPNPAYRAEDFVATKLEQLKRNRHPPAEYLSTALIALGNDLGSSTSFGNCLVQCGQAELMISQMDLDFQEEAVDKFVKPLRGYLDQEIKTLHKERRALEAKRLDLDAAKSRYKKASNDANKTSNGKPLSELESELRISQSEFNSQVERTKLLLDNLGNAQSYHQHCLMDFVKVQAVYYEKCHQEMQKLMRQLASNPYFGDGV